VTAGGLEKFAIICSLCGLEKSVPFKPEPGRPAYCKECIAKIKSGEVKVEKSSENQIKYDDSKFFKPLSDLGIEFPDRGPSGINNNSVAKKDGGQGEEKNKVPERTDNAPKPFSKPSTGILSSIKQVFTDRPKPKPAGAPNLALKEALSKTLAEKEVVPVAPKVEVKPPTPQPPTPEPVSLDTLKNKLKESTEVVKKDFSNTKDRSASSENVNKLKDLISAKVAAPVSTPVSTPAPVVPKPVEVVVPVAKTVEPPKAPEPVVIRSEPKVEAPKAPTPPPAPAPKVEGTEPPLTADNIKEVPEDVLMKILGEE
jgi:CxxC-x17-CxxC domain-containing protein